MTSSVLDTSHQEFAVAAALKADDISAYVRWFKGLKVTPNFAEYGRPQSARSPKKVHQKESRKK